MLYLTTEVRNMELIDQIHEKAITRLEAWAKNRLVDGDRTSAAALYADYSAWIYQYSYRDSQFGGGRPMSQNIWGQWMRRRYAKTIFRGLTHYVGVALGPLPQTVIPESGNKGNGVSEI